MQTEGPKMDIWMLAFPAVLCTPYLNQPSLFPCSPSNVRSLSSQNDGMKTGVVDPQVLAS